MSEKNIQSEIMLTLSSMGALVWRNQVGTFRALNNDGIVKIGQTGQADLMAVYNSKFIGIEVKTLKGKQADDQKLWQYALEKRGGIYRVCRSVQDAVDLINSLK
jgi:hypothetical protein